jgi:hypothetical protein
MDLNGQLPEAKLLRRRGSIGDQNETRLTADSRERVFSRFRSVKQPQIVSINAGGRRIGPPDLFARLYPVECWTVPY